MFSGAVSETSKSARSVVGKKFQLVELEI